MSSTIAGNGEKSLVLASGRAHPELANDVARELGIDLLPTTAYDFANGEIYVRFGESVRGADVFILQSHTAPINQWIMEQLLMVDAAKRASARTITVVQQPETAQTSLMPESALQRGAADFVLTIDGIAALLRGLDGEGPT